MANYGGLGSSDTGGQWNSNQSNTVYWGSPVWAPRSLGVKDTLGTWSFSSVKYWGSGETLEGALGLRDTKGAWMDNDGLYWITTYTFSGLQTMPNPYVGQIFPTGGSSVGVGQLFTF
jgi:hypothetical protein